MKATIFSLALGATFAFASIVRAQGSTGPTPLDVLGSTENFSYVGSPGYQPTLEEGILRGTAEVGRAAADLNYLSAEGAKRIEEARSIWLDSRVKSINDYYLIRQINHENTIGKIQRFSTEQMAALAHKQAPDRLAAHQYEPMNGRLVWPSILKTEEFAAHREALNEVFARRSTRDVGEHTDFHVTVRDLTDEMELMLHDHINHLLPMEYVSAKRFLNGLEQEALMAPGSAGLAMSR